MPLRSPSCSPLSSSLFARRTGVRSAGDSFSQKSLIHHQRNLLFRVSQTTADRRRERRRRRRRQRAPGDRRSISRKRTAVAGLQAVSASRDTSAPLVPYHSASLPFPHVPRPSLLLPDASVALHASDTDVMLTVSPPLLVCRQSPGLLASASDPLPPVTNGFVLLISPVIHHLSLLPLLSALC